jgi:alanine racemase
LSDAAARAGAVLTIDLAAVVENWRRLMSRAPGTRGIGIVKADAYGIGAMQVGAALAKEGCTRFGVATLDEGISLRRVLPDAEILIHSGPFAHTEADFVANRLWPILNSPEQIALWAAHAKALGRKLPAVIHIDTGLSRLGLSEAETRAFAADSATRAAFDLKMVMSHLAVGEEPTHPLNKSQLDRFAALRRLFPETEASLAASAGIFLGPDWHFDWVRLGASLYGVNPTPHQANPMQQVVDLKARIVQVRDIDQGETVGYGATWRAPGRTRLAVVAAGYADGLLRALSNRGSAMVGESRVPLVGRVSMDLMVFDVGALPEDAVRPGGFVTLIGAGNDIDQVAAAAGTNGYEILTQLGRRYHRIWTGA